MSTITPRLLEDSETFRTAFDAPKYSGPVVTGAYVEAVTPNGPGTTGGVRIRVNAADEAYLQILSADGVAERYNLKFKAGLMVASGMVTTLRAAADAKNDFLTAAAGVFITADGFWQGMRIFDLTDAPIITIDYSKSINFSVTITDNRTLDFPQNLKQGQRGFIRVRQDSTGGRLLAFASGYRYEDNVTAPILNSAANAVTVLRYEVTGSGEVTIFGGKAASAPVIVEATAQEYRSAVAGKVVTPDKVWIANQVAPITEASLVTGVNFNNFINASVTLTGNRVIGNPVGGMKPGQSGCITFTMGGSGGYTLTFGDQWFSSGSVVPMLPAAVGGVHRMYYTITDTNSIDFFFGVNMGRTYDPDVQAYFTAMTSQPTATRKALINNFILGLKTDGIWTLLDNLWLLASHDEQSSRVNLIRPSKLLVKIGTPVFIADLGWQQDATGGATANNQLQSPDAYFGPNLRRTALHSLSYGIWQNTAFTETQNGYLCGEASNSFYDYLLCNNTATVGRIASSSASINSGQVKGFKAVTHVVGDANMFVTQNNTSGSGAYNNTNNNSSSTFALLGAGASSAYPGTNNRQAAGFTGTGLTTAQLTSLYNRLNTYLTAIGAN
jgi:hypothetical protein